MGEFNKVAVHKLDGSVLKGTTQDFYPNRPAFHVQPVGGGPSVEVSCRELKAIFFVRDLAGRGSRRDIRGFINAPGETAQGKKLAVLFRDGELVCGYSLAYGREREGFFLHPADRGSNNTRIYVFAATAMEVKTGPAADLLAQKVLDSRAA